MKRLLSVGPLAVAVLLSGAFPAHALIELSSCQNLTEAGETYRLTGNISAGGGCLTVSAPNIVIDGDDGAGGRRVLTYATSSNGPAISVLAAGAEIRNLVLRNGAHANSSNNGTTTIYAAEANGLNVHHNTFDLTNNGSHYFSAMRLPPSSASDLRIQHNTFDLDGTFSLSAIISDGDFESPPSYVGEISHNTMSLGGSLHFPAGSLRSYHVSINGMTSAGGRLAIHHNTMTSGSGTGSPHGIALYRVDNVDVYSNQITDNGGGGRLLLLDSGSDNNRVYDNVLVANGSPNSALRVRYGSNYNELYGNSVTCNAGGTAVFLGSSGFGNVLHDNTFSASDFVVRFEEDYSITTFYNNSLTVKNGAGAHRAIYFYEFGNVMRGITFSNDTITRQPGVSEAPIHFIDTGANGPDEIVFCPLTVDGVVVTPANQGTYIQRGSGTGISYTVGSVGCGVEVEPACSDGVDNDGDGLADHPADPGCSSAEDSDERAAGAACDDGVDNDGDGLTDYRAVGGDPGCTSPTATSENNCGNGVADGAEDCDGGVAEGFGCGELGFDRGTLACSDTCSFDTTACESDCAVLSDKSGWSVAYADSEDLLPGGALPAVHAIDGNPATFWHTRWSSTPVPAHPHELQVDLGGPVDVCGFVYLPRQDTGVENMDGTVREYALYLSPTGGDWGDPVASGELVPAGSTSKAPVTVFFPTVNSRFVRIVAFSDTEGTPYTSMAELDVMGGVWPSSGGAAVPGPPPAVYRTDMIDP